MEKTKITIESRNQKTEESFESDNQVVLGINLMITLFEHLITHDDAA